LGVVLDLVWSLEGFKMSARIRKFDREDFRRFGGASAWDNGDAPVICEMFGWEIIADSERVEAHTPDEEFGMCSLSLPEVVFPNAKAATMFLAGLMANALVNNDLDLVELGFEPC